MNVETAVNPVPGKRFHYVFDTQTGLPVEQIQRFLNDYGSRLVIVKPMQDN